MYEFDLVLLLLQQMCVFLVIAWLMSKTRLFIPLMQVTVRLPHKLLCYVTFSIFCILGTYFGLHIEDSIANTRAIGAVMGGLLGGPVVGGLVGLTGGLHRYSLGGMTALSCMVSTYSAGWYTVFWSNAGGRTKSSARSPPARSPFSPRWCRC